jgi:hypothetical protein
MRPIYQIQVHRTQRFLVAGTFLCGGLVLTFSCLRLNALLSLDLLSIDLVWSYVDTWNWTAMGVHVAIISVCLPTLRPFYRFLRVGSSASIPPRRVSPRRAAVRIQVCPGCGRSRTETHIQGTVRLRRRLKDMRISPCNLVSGMGRLSRGLAFMLLLLDAKAEWCMSDPCLHLYALTRRTKEIIR